MDKEYSAMISYCITVYNEIDEISRLLEILKSCIHTGDEIVVVQTYRDHIEKDSETYKNIHNIVSQYADKFDSFHFQNHFSDLKNFLNSKASKQNKYIFNLDADETVDMSMVESIYQFLVNCDIDLLYVPRVNIVEGLTEEDIKKWKWNVNDRGWVNWPDYQARIYKNTSSIKWIGKVHEYITGQLSQAAIEADGNIYISHVKKIERQRKQNTYYENI